MSVYAAFVRFLAIAITLLAAAILVVGLTAMRSHGTPKPDVAHQAKQELADEATACRAQGYRWIVGYGCYQK